MGCTNSKASEPTSKRGKPEQQPTAPPPATAPAKEEQEQKVPEKATDLPLQQAGPACNEPNGTGCSPIQAPIHAPSAPVIHDAASAGSPPVSTQGDAKTDEHGRRKVSAATMPACFFKNAMHNGFRTLAELPSVTVPDDQCAAWTLPAECLTYEPPPDAVISKFKNGDQERKIHNNTELSASEVERLQGMRKEAKSLGVDFYPSVTSMATRFLSRARMDSRKAVKLMKETQDWRAEFFKDGPITAESVSEDLKHGIVYFSGRDYALRPAIVIRANRIPAQWYKERRIDRFIRVLIFCMEYFLRYMIVPGRVENLSVIVDLATLGISQVPLSALSEVYKVMSHHYIGRVYKFYVCNVSGFLSALASGAKSLLTDRQRQKLNMLDNVEELRKEFALTQLETDLGGSRPKLDKFFPFPLNPGPFEPNFAGPPDTSSVPMVHECLSLAGAIGRLWDPKLSVEANRRLEYTGKAAEIMERCGLPVPPEAHLDYQATMASLASSGKSGCASTGLIEGQDGKLNAASAEFLHIQDSGAPIEDQDLAQVRHEEDINGAPGDFAGDAELQSTAVCGKGLFCCAY